jgi:hypothetical protein
MFASRPSAGAGGAEPAAGPKTAAAAPLENHAPEMGEVRFKRVGVGQRIFFGLSVIDEETDDLRVEMLEKPASAKYNEKTLTVDWTPRKTDGRAGKFAIRITEYVGQTNEVRRTLVKNFSIAVEPRAVVLPTVEPAPLAVETLISITDPERLAASNARWPILSMFDRIAEIEASKQARPDADVQPTTGAALFRDSLRNLAALHHNDEINPDSPQFNPQWNSENWRLIMVRPRVNKKVFELRLVYRNVVAAEPVYLMPRMRIMRAKVKDAKLPDDLRQKNNETFARLFYDAFFDGQNLKPFVAGDKRKYGEALSGFITKVVTYSDPKDPSMQANFAALPHNARLGGGDRFDPQGRYLRGDGWALGVMKVKPIRREGAKPTLAFSNEPVDGFVTSIKAKPDQSAYAPVPAPRFNRESREFVAGWDKLIDQDDMPSVRIPDEHDPTSASNIDSSVFSRDFKVNFMLAETPLRDPRRRLFEERGMTCIQCHVRNFDEGNYLDQTVRDPKKAAGSTDLARDIPRLFFVLTPDEGRSEFMRRNEEEQVGNLKGVLRDYLNVRVNIGSLLADEWPFNTRIGRS